MRSDEAAMVLPLLRKELRKRTAEMLGNPKRRKKFLDRLGHFDGLAREHRVPIASASHDEERIWVEKELRRRGADDNCYDLLEGEDMSLQDALDEAYGQAYGRLIICIPGRLAYFESEDDRYIVDAT